MIFAALSEAAARGELILVQDGLCRWHRRRDGVVVIHEILVLPFRHGTGVGRRLVGEVRVKNPGCPVVARCPREYEANRFWHALGFVKTTEAGRCNVWRWDPTSSTVPTETRPSPLPQSAAAGSTVPDSPAG